MERNLSHIELVPTFNGQWIARDQLFLIKIYLSLIPLETFQNVFINHFYIYLPITLNDKILMKNCTSHRTEAK